MENIIKPQRLPRIFLLAAILSISLAIGTSVSWAIVVTTTADSGAGSLREAITDANTDGVPTPITFDPTVFPGTITLATELPPLTEDLGDTIDGTGTGVVIDGSAFSPDGREIGLTVHASNITVRGLTIQNFDGDGIRVESPSAGGDVKDVVISQNVLQNNRNGLRVSGGPDGGSKVTFIASNNEVKDSGRRGIRVTGGDGNNNKVSGTVSNNEVEDSGRQGILVNDGTGSNNKVSGTISKNAVEDSGRLAIRAGILVSGAGTTVAGITDNESNGNTDDGITVRASVLGSGATPISGNQTNNNGNDGIDINGTGYVVLANEADDNAVDGINAVGNVNGGGNTASGNATCNGPTFCF